MKANTDYKMLLGYISTDDPEDAQDLRDAVAKRQTTGMWKVVRLDNGSIVVRRAGEDRHYLTPRSQNALIGEIENLFLVQEELSLDGFVYYRRCMARNG